MPLLEAWKISLKNASFCCGVCSSLLFSPDNMERRGEERRSSSGAVWHEALVESYQEQELSFLSPNLLGSGPQL